MNYTKSIPRRLLKALIGSTVLTFLLLAPPAFAQQSQLPPLHTTNNYPGHQTVNNTANAALTVFEVIALIGVIAPAGMLGWQAWKGNEIDSGRMWKVLGLSLLGLYILSNLGGFTQTITSWIQI